MSKLPIWSWSSSRDFQRCPRQWYYKSILANALAKDDRRHEAYRLSKLKSISAWRGSLVDAVISEKIIPVIKNKGTVKFMEIKEYAHTIFDQQWQMAVSPSVKKFTQESTKNASISGTKENIDKHQFHAIEYSVEITPEERTRALAEVDMALDNLSSMDELLNKLGEATTLLVQKYLTYPFNGITVRAVPDLLAFFYNAPPLIVDWKVSIFADRDYRLQLGTYALAYYRCQSRFDFPTTAAHYSPTDIRLLEVQLLSGLIREYTLTEFDIAEIDDYIFQSIMQMKLTLGDVPAGQLQPFDFPVTSYPDTCERCNYRSLCWQEKLLWDKWKQTSFL